MSRAIGSKLPGRTRRVVEGKIFRTDRGGKRDPTEKEWNGGHRGLTDTDGDKSGDDDVDILLQLDESVQVAHESDGD